MDFKVLSSEELISIAEKFTNVIIKESESGQLIFTEQGARLLGVFPKTGGDNVLWVNADLETYFHEHHALVGGNRLSILPEKSFFYENPRDFEGYHVPSEIDPGEYSCIENSDTLIYENNFSLLAYDKNRLYDNSIERREFKLISDPYSTGLSFAGVTVSDSITILDREIKIAASSLTKVVTNGANIPGTILIPVNQGCDLLSYYEPLSPEDSDIFEQYCRFKIDGEKTCKIAVKPEDIQINNPCKIIYMSPSPSDKTLWSCVIVRSTDMPKTQIDCVNIPETDPKGPKGAIQALNASQGVHETEFYQFGELVLQFTQGSIVDDTTVCNGDHELLSYCGTENDIHELAKTALQTEKPLAIY